MIVLDIETSGLTPNEGIWQIGAIDLNDPRNVFLEEARIDDEDKIDPGALKITGKTEEDFRDKNKQSQKELISNYLDWVSKIDEKVIFGHNIGWDISMIQTKCFKYNLFEKFAKIHRQRGIDLYTIAQIRNLQIKGSFAKKEDGKGAFSLSHVLEFCGISDNRIAIVDYSANTIREGKAHNAIDDCKLEAECFFRLTKGEGFFEEFKMFEIPHYLKK